jgi:phosphotransferase system HPr (HPr) family protein
MVQAEVTVLNDPGLHTRPASMLASLAARFKSRITISDGDEQVVDAKSIMGILMLAAITGTRLTIAAEGEDEAEAVRAVAHLVNSGFEDAVMQDEKNRVSREGGA